MRITDIKITHHQLKLDPPFLAAWDSKPRSSFTATIVRVQTDQGLEGIGSGDYLDGFHRYQDLFIGQDPRDADRLHKILENISFHGSRCWPVDLALWDLAGKLQEKPVYQLLGNETDRLKAYCSFGSHRSPSETAEWAVKMRERGFRALKIRFGRENIKDDFEVLEAVRNAVGESLEIMVDCNQGWRMPWDTATPWTVDKAMEVALALQNSNVYWMEEPLHRGDYQGMTKLRNQCELKIAGGEMTQEPYEFRELLERQCLDVFQPDATLCCGITGLIPIAKAVKSQGKIFTPHTWGNGIGLLANLHLTAGITGTPFIEFPFDPLAGWTNERRDFMLRSALDIDEQGNVLLPPTHGLGIQLDEQRLSATRL